MTTLGTSVGCIWSVDPLVMGILVLAVGTSVPDAVASMIVAKGGQGDMAIANGGSFQILFFKYFFPQFLI